MVSVGSPARDAMPDVQRPARHDRPAFWVSASAASNERDAVALDSACKADCAPTDATCIACRATFFACNAAWSALQCGLNTDRCGLNVERRGLNTERCGINPEQCGINPERCGINPVRCDIKDDRGRSNVGAMASVRRPMAFEHGETPFCFAISAICTSTDGITSSCNRV
jgi:hypothetical protein